MSSQMSYGTGSSMLFQSMNDDLNASLATADELSREFSSLLQEASASSTTQPTSQTISVVPRERSTPMVVSSTLSPASSPSTVTVFRDTAGGGRISPSNSTSSSAPFSPSSTSPRPLNNVISGAKNRPSSPVHQRQSAGPPRSSSSSSSSSDHFTYGQMSPNQSPQTQRRNSPSRYNRSPRGSITHMDAGLLPIPGSIHAGQRSPQPGLRPRGSLPHIDPGPMASPTLQVPYDGAGHGGRRSPQPDRSSSPRPYSHPMSSTLPRNFGAFKQADDSMQRQKSAGKWNETDLDASYERKAHHTYNKTDWLRPSVPNSNWKESNLDGPPPGPSPKKDSLSRSQQQPSHVSLQPSHASLPRNARISVPPDVSSPAHSPYHPQPIISRISIPPTTAPPRQRKPIPLSVIMRLQNPTWDPYAYHPMAMGMEDVCPYQGAMPMPMPMSRPMPMPMPMPMPREFFHQPMYPPSQPHAHEMMQPAFYNEVLNPGDVDAEIESLDLVPAAPEMPRASDKAGGEAEQAAALAPPRPLSPTRLQPVVAPEAQSQDLPDLEELLRIRAEIPRALKRRGSVQSGSPGGQADHGSQSVPLKKASHYEPNQYKHLINKLFRRKGPHHKKEHGQESSSSSEGEEIPAQPPPALPAPLTSTPVLQDHRGYHSILRRASREHRGTGRRARLSPLVLLLDGSLVGELDTVKRAVQEMSDPSQPNDEGITALHNAICGGHYNVVDFLVRIGANVSTPDSHGWTPLHCAASCNDRILCEFLVRNGAAVMAMTESDGATAAQKCDPYAVGYEECVSFLRGVEEAMGVENSGVLYALWSYPAQAPDELSFKEGDMVTILQKPEGVHWWWASLCGREGFVPNNYFGLFPKVRPKSLC